MKARTPKKAASTPRKRKASDKEQYERFRQAARELGADESEEAFERAFSKVIGSRRRFPRRKTASDPEK